MKFLIAFALVVLSMVSAEGPRFRPVSARQEAGYEARGWRPAGQEFNLPFRSQNQMQQQPPVPAASYGPPPETSYGPPEETTEAISTTTETIEQTTTLEPEAENIVDTRAKPAKLQAPGSYYVVVPQTQKYIVAPQLTMPRAKLISAQAQAVPSKLPIQAIPAFAKIQEAPEVLETFPVIQAVPVASSAYTSSVYTPFASSFIQVFQQ